jgi:hypothetical protein
VFACVYRADGTRALGHAAALARKKRALVHVGNGNIQVRPRDRQLAIEDQGAQQRPDFFFGQSDTGYMRRGHVAVHLRDRHGRHHVQRRQALPGPVLLQLEEEGRTVISIDGKKGPGCYTSTTATKAHAAPATCALP